MGIAANLNLTFLCFRPNNTHLCLYLPLQLWKKYKKIISLYKTFTWWFQRHVSKCCNGGKFTLQSDQKGIEPQLVFMLKMLYNSIGSNNYMNSTETASKDPFGSQKIPTSLTVCLSHTLTFRSECYFLFSNFSLYWGFQMKFRISVIITAIAISELIVSRLKEN